MSSSILRITRAAIVAALVFSSSAQATDRVAIALDEWSVQPIQRGQAMILAAIEALLLAESSGGAKACAEGRSLTMIQARLEQDSIDHPTRPLVAAVAGYIDCKKAPTGAIVIEKQKWKGPTTPMSADTWSAMDIQTKTAYASVSLEALGTSPKLAGCARVQPTTMVKRIDEARFSGEPLMMAVAVAAYDLCPEPETNKNQ